MLLLLTVTAMIIVRTTAITSTEIIVIAAGTKHYCQIVLNALIY